MTTLKGIVRGARTEGGGLSGLGYVILEVDPDATIPRGLEYHELGSLTREDGLQMDRAIALFGDARSCADLAARLLDKRVGVILGANGPILRVTHQGRDSKEVQA